MFITAIIGAVIGAFWGGAKAYRSGNSIWLGALKGAAIGGAVGFALGALSSMALVGSVMASSAEVFSGLTYLNATISAGGLGAGGTYLLDNLSRAFNGAGTVLYSGGDAAKKVAYSVGGTTIDDSIGKAAEIITRNMQWTDAEPIWKDFSASFCRQASGVVNAYISASNFRGLDSVFLSVELPTLLNNPKVTEIVIHIFE